MQWYYNFLKYKDQCWPPNFLKTLICILKIMTMAAEEQEVIRQYLWGLENGNAAQIIRLFSKSGIVHSPLYGRQPARDFYQALFKDTARSEISLFHIFRESEKSSVASAHFRYDWWMRDGSAHSFECVDIFHFDEVGKIQELRIIYDTQSTRKSFNQLS